MCIFSPRHRFFPAGFSGRFLRFAWILGWLLWLALPSGAGPAWGVSPDIRIPGAEADTGDTGGLRVAVDLPGVKVYLDGELAGLAHPDRPLIRPVWPVGEVRVAVRAKGIEEKERTLTVRSGETAEVRFRIRPRPPEIRRHLAAAAEAMSAGRLSDPPDASAFHHFREALSLEPDLPEARAGLRELVAAHRRRGEAAESRRDFQRAGAEYRAGLEVARFLADGADPSLSEEFEALAAGRERARLLARPVAELLWEADDLFDRERYLAPPGENAFERYRAALIRSPENARARNQIQAMADHYGRLSAQRESEDLSLSADYSRNRARLLRFLREELNLSVDPAEILAAEHRAETLSRRVAAAAALAREGDTFFIARRLLTPERGNAFDKYRAALAEDPTNRRARERLGEMVDLYRERAESAFEAGPLEPARRAYRRLSTVADFADSVFSDAEIRASAALAQVRLTALEIAAERLEAGDERRADGRWTRPEGESAVSAYKEALERHPGNARALSGLRSMMAALTESAREAETAGRWVQAADALADFSRVAQPAAAATGDPDLRAALERAEIRTEELRIQGRKARLDRLRERLDEDMARYRELVESETENRNVAGQVTPVLRRMVETLGHLAGIYDGLPGLEMEKKRDRLRKTQARLERELRARAEKAF